MQSNLVLLFLSGVHNVFADLSTPLTIDGIGNITGCSGTVYDAYNYRPICGTLSADEKTAVELTEQCTPAFQHFRSLSDTFSLYDLTGVRLPDLQPIGAGTTLCMCFSLADVAADQAKGDFCIAVGPHGEQDVWWSIPTQSRAAGNFQLGTKALPQCADTNLADVQSSLSAASATFTPTSTAETTQPSGESSVAKTPPNPTTSSPNPGPSANQPSSSSQGSPPGSPGGPLSIGIWMPILISALAALFGIHYKRKRLELDKRRLALERQKAMNDQLRMESVNLARRLQTLESRGL